MVGRSLNKLTTTGRHRYLSTDQPDTRNRSLLSRSRVNRAAEAARRFGGAVATQAPCPTYLLTYLLGRPMGRPAATFYPQPHTCSRATKAGRCKLATSWAHGSRGLQGRPQLSRMLICMRGSSPQRLGGPMRRASSSPQRLGGPIWRARGRIWRTSTWWLRSCSSTLPCPSTRCSTAGEVCWSVCCGPRWM